MEKQISVLMTRVIRTVDFEDTIDKVDALLTELKVSAVPVVDHNGTLFGIISSLDLLHFFAARRNPRATRAWELCTYKPVSVCPETSVSEVASLMLGKRIHHILVIENGKLIGIVSAMDFVKQCLPGLGNAEAIETDELAVPHA